MAIIRRPPTVDEPPVDESADETAPSPWVGRHLTLDELLALPDESPHLEYDDGVVTQKAAPKPVHGSIQLFLAQVIDAVARPGRLGIVLPETRIVAPRWVPVPDLVFYRRERLRSRQAPPDFTEPPDLAIEIASPGHSRADLMRKCLRFLANGTAVVLMVDPEDEAALVFRPDQPPRIYTGGERIDLDDVLPGFELTVRQLFEAVNWEWLDEPSASEARGEAPADSPAAQADDAAASERSGG